MDVSYLYHAIAWPFLRTFTREKDEWREYRVYNDDQGLTSPVAASNESSNQQKKSRWLPFKMADGWDKLQQRMDN